MATASAESPDYIPAASSMDGDDSCSERDYQASRFTSASSAVTVCSTNTELRSQDTELTDAASERHTPKFPEGARRVSNLDGIDQDESPSAPVHRAKDDRFQSLEPVNKDSDVNNSVQTIGATEYHFKNCDAPVCHERDTNTAALQGVVTSTPGSPPGGAVSGASQEPLSCVSGVEQQSASSTSEPASVSLLLPTNSAPTAEARTPSEQTTTLSMHRSSNFRSQEMSPSMRFSASIDFSPAFSNIDPSQFHFYDFGIQDFLVMRQHTIVDFIQEEGESDGVQQIDNYETGLSLSPKHFLSDSEISLESVDLEPEQVLWEKRLTENTFLLNSLVQSRVLRDVHSSQGMRRRARPICLFRQASDNCLVKLNSARGSAARRRPLLRTESVSEFRCLAGRGSGSRRGSPSTRLDGDLVDQH